MDEKIVIGLMSGTSADGIDATIVRIKPDFSFSVIDSEIYHYDKEIKILDFASANIKTVCEMNFKLAELFADACLKLIKKSGLTKNEVDLVASHGQTVWHEPNGNPASTLQLGDGSVIAQKTGIYTISNFRTADIAEGGEGAPLVPFADKIIFSSSSISRCIQNIGGMSNVSVISPNCEIFAFDNGAGNILIDLAMQKFFNKNYDKDGEIALSGRVDNDWLDILMQEKYLKINPPKSTGRELFNDNYLEKILTLNPPNNPQDIVATITAFSAKSIHQSYKDFILPKTKIDEIVLGGGGAYNRAIIHFLEQYFKKTKVLTHEDFGISSNFKEAIAFALLGYASYYKIPNNLPSCTGAKKPVIMGQHAIV